MRFVPAPARTADLMPPPSAVLRDIEPIFGTGPVFGDLTADASDATTALKRLRGGKKAKKSKRQQIDKHWSSGIFAALEEVAAELKAAEMAALEEPLPKEIPMQKPKKKKGKQSAEMAALEETLPKEIPLQKPKKKSQ